LGLAFGGSIAFTPSTWLGKGQLLYLGLGTPSAMTQPRDRAEVL
jgi:hypothetical protein